MPRFPLAAIAALMLLPAPALAEVFVADEAAEGVEGPEFMPLDSLRFGRRPPRDEAS